MQIVESATSWLASPSWSFSLRAPERPPYPDYTRNIARHPDRSQFRDAWNIVFKSEPELCEIKNLFSFRENQGLVVKTPGRTFCNGGIMEYTVRPLLRPDESVYYSGCGCTWSIDVERRRFHYLDPNTDWPVGFEEVRAIETIRRRVIQTLGNN